MTVRDAYCEMYRLIRYVIRRRLANQPASQRDELFSEALCHSWQAFQWSFPKSDEDLCKAARIAGSLAAKRAASGYRYASTRTGGYVDALDSKVQREKVDLGLFPAPLAARQPSYDTHDMTKVCQRISNLPEHLKGVAFCLAANDDMRALVRSVIGGKAERTGELKQAEIAAYCGCTDRQVRNRIESLRMLFAGQSDAKRNTIAALCDEWNS